jgi:hypothetical protein
VKKLIVLRLVAESANGNWMEVEPMRAPYFMQLGYSRTELVATGDVEWDGFDNCAEVYVPKNRLNDWRRMHAIETDAR